jgi:2-succinyl-6-hydroxy-2,4-cyclohexadiene-1-carboxylate synthase
LLSKTFELVCIDLPGHGVNAEIETDLHGAGRLLVEAGGPQPFHLLGYSLGARVSLHAALFRPSAISSLTLIGATGGIDDDDERRARKARDDEMADNLEKGGDVTGFLRRWLTNPMFSDLTAEAAGLGARENNSAHGLATSLRLCGTGNQTPLWTRLCELKMATLALAGACDIRFSLHAQRIAKLVEHGMFSTIPGANHAAHLSQPHLVAAFVRHFISP